MATRIGSVGLVLLLGILVGCQTPPATHAYSAPSFEGPRQAQPKAIAKTYAPPVMASHTVVPPPPMAMAVKPNLMLAAIPSAWVPPVPARPWKWIVIHHSATTTGGALAFDKMHRAKGWDELGYDFVIGNGTDTTNGQIEVGPRWAKQKIGAHAKTADNRFNEFGIGICLVGNFDLERPTPEQIKSVDKLVAYLMATYDIPADHVMGHRDTKSTDCPGKYMYLALPQLRQTAGAIAGATAYIKTKTAATTELLTTVGDAH